MPFRWFEEDEPFIHLPKKRQTFYDTHAAEIEAHTPGSIEQMTNHWRARLREVIDGQRDGIKVDDLGPDWSGTSFQVIYDTLGDWNLSRWFTGVHLMKTVMEHPERFCAYKAEEESSTVYFRDNRFYLK